MNNNFVKAFLRWVTLFTVLIAVIILSIPVILYFNYRRYIYVSVDSVQNNSKTAMVLGAAVYPNDTPSMALQERLDMSVALYEAGKIDKILVSGSKDTGTYDEARAMKAELVKSGVPESIIMEDNLGARTFESCKRAKSEFGIQSLLIVSQGFHLPRALFLCRSVGIQSTGIYALGAFSSNHSDWYNIREIGAMYVAVWDILQYKK